LLGVTHKSNVTPPVTFGLSVTAKLTKYIKNMILYFFIYFVNFAVTLKPNVTGGVTLDLCVTPSKISVRA
jgi:hypothetical protein